MHLIYQNLQKLTQKYIVYLYAMLMVTFIILEIITKKLQLNQLQKYLHYL
jgi:hypothetical protein